MKRLISILFIAIFIITGAVAINAQEDAVASLAALNILKGDENGNLMLDKAVSRYQAALFFAQAISGDTDPTIWNAQKNSSVFTDVKNYGTAIDYTKARGVIAGRDAKTFDPEGGIIYQDMLVMAVRALGYETAGMSYPYEYILTAQKLKLVNNLSIKDYKKTLTRGETAQIIWNMLNTEVAVKDPITNKVMYPGEEGLTDSIIGKPIERKTLLSIAGFATNSFDFVIEDVKTKNEEFYVIVNGEEELASKFGITARTPKKDYLGLGGKAYTNGDEIVMVKFNNYDSLVNLDAKATLFKDYQKFYFTFTNKGWKPAATPTSVIGYYQYRIIGKNIEILYTPIEFGTFGVKQSVYTPTLTKELFYTINNKTVDGYPVYDTMSKMTGEKSKEVEVRGEATNGDYIFYHYNDIDNIIEVYENCGAPQVGRLTSVGKDSVKINSVRYALAKDRTRIYTPLLDILSKNVNYILYNNEIIYLQPAINSKTETTITEFAIISTNSDIMKSVYGNDYSLVDGLYLSNNKIGVARLNLETGKWEKFYFSKVATNYIDEKYNTFINVADLAKYSDIGVLTPEKQKEYDYAKSIIHSAIVAIVNNDTIANKDNIIFNDTIDKLTFNSEGRTNALSADKTISPSRISTKENSIIVAINGRDVRVRVGVQGAKQSLTHITGIYAASSDLIIVTTDIDLDHWAKVVTAGQKAYYLITPKTEINVENQGTLVFTIDNIFNLTTNKYVTLVTESKDITKINDYTIGTILTFNDYKELEVYAGTIKSAIAREGYFEPKSINFIDNETIIIDDIVSADQASKINATVVTINMTDKEIGNQDYYVRDEKYDPNKFMPRVAEVNGKYAYAVKEGVTTITEPVVGIYSNFEMAMANKTIVCDGADAFKVEINTLVKYDKDNNIVDLYILKLIQNP